MKFGMIIILLHLCSFLFLVASNGGHKRWQLC